MEAAPVGLQRVEDYGGRERRELQANVFAREFLLPQQIARHLHVDKHQSATTIAQDLRLPINLVRQQLLDALLYPIDTAENHTVAEAAVPPVLQDTAQDRAARHKGSAFQLQAGPGTGKTRTVVQRVVALLEEGVAPGAILVLTFSNRAARELLNRIAAAVPHAATHIWIGTFHAFGLDILRRYHDRLGLPPDPILFDRCDAIEVLEEILPTLGLHHYQNLRDPTLVLGDVLGAISRAKDEMADPGHYLDLARSMQRLAEDEKGGEAAEKALEVARVYECYERELRARGAVDFGDLVMRPTQLLEEDESVRITAQLRHRHIIVDEYQDVNRASGRLLRSIAGDGQRLWVVGDSRQSIYRFRGASSMNMTMFIKEYPEVHVDQLTVSYRSSDEIVHALVHMAPHLAASEGMLPLDFKASRGPTGIKPQIRRYSTIDDEAEGIADSILELVKQGVELRDQAVLGRSNDRLSKIAAVLESRGIPVLHLGSLFERNEIRNLLSLLSLAIDSSGNGLVRVGAMERYAIPLQDVYVVLQLLKEAGHPPLTMLRDIASGGRLSSQGASGLARLVQDLDGLTASVTPWEFLTTYLLDRTRDVAELATRMSVRERMNALAIWQFLNFARDTGPSLSIHPIRRLLDRVRRMVLLAEDRELRQVPNRIEHIDAVHLLTVHGSKGLEFEAVHIPGLTVTSFPTSYRSQPCPPPSGLISDSSIPDEGRPLSAYHE